jgi:hypothetical protein
MEILSSLLHGGISDLGVNILLLLDEILCFENASLRKNTTFISSEVLISLEIASGWAVSQDVFHHLLLCNLSIATSNDVSALHFCKWLAFFIHGTCLSFGHARVWSTHLAHQVSIFSEITIKYWLASIAAFVQKVAAQNLLWT